MEDDKMLEEVIDETIEDSNEETQEEVNEVEETTDEPNSNDDSSSPTLEDFEALKKKAETLQAQKEHWRKKAEKSATTNKPNNTEFSDEEKLVRLAQLGKDLDSEDLDILKGLNGTSIEEKVNNPLFKAFKAEKERKKRSGEASLKPSTPGRTFTKSDPNEPGLSPEERDARIKKSMGLA